MELLLLFVLIVSFIWYIKDRHDKGDAGKRNNSKKSPSVYKRKIKAILKAEGPFEKNCSAMLDTLLDMAQEEGIQDFFHKTYGKMCDFREDEIIFESYFLLVFGDQRNHYVYTRDSKSNRFIPAYEEYYKGNKEMNLIVTNKRLYVGDDLNQKNKKKPLIIPLHKIESIEQTSDYVEITIKTKLAGQRIHNIWNSSGNDSLFYLLRCLLEQEKNSKNSENISSSHSNVL